MATANARLTFIFCLLDLLATRGFFNHSHAFTFVISMDNKEP